MTASARHSAATRWLHAGLALTVVLDLTCDIVMQAPRGGHPGNLFYPLHQASDLATLLLAVGLGLAGVGSPGLRGRSGWRRGLLVLVAALAASGLWADFGNDSVVLGHAILAALVWVALPGHLLVEMLRHYGRDDGLAEMWSLWRQSR